VLAKSLFFLIFQVPALFPTLDPTMDSSTVVPMRPLSNSQEEIENQQLDEQHGLEFSLPQADGGKDAWLFLAACFIVEALVWGNHPSKFFKNIWVKRIIGFPFSFGVFQEYYSTHEPFSSNPTGIDAIGTTATVLSLTRV